MESVYSAFRVYRDIIFASILLHNLVTVQALNARFDPTSGQIEFPNSEDYITTF